MGKQGAWGAEKVTPGKGDGSSQKTRVSILNWGKRIHLDVLLILFVKLFFDNRDKRLKFLNQDSEVEELLHRYCFQIVMSIETEPRNNLVSGNL